MLDQVRHSARLLDPQRDTERLAGTVLEHNPERNQFAKSQEGRAGESRIVVVGGGGSKKRSPSVSRAPDSVESVSLPSALSA